MKFEYSAVEKLLKPVQRDYANVLLTLEASHVGDLAPRSACASCRCPLVIMCLSLCSENVVHGHYGGSVVPLGWADVLEDVGPGSMDMLQLNSRPTLEVSVSMTFSNTGYQHDISTASS
jgi:hypothetical protein